MICTNSAHVIAVTQSVLAPSPATVGEGWGGVAWALAQSRCRDKFRPHEAWGDMRLAARCTSRRSLRSHPTLTLPCMQGR